MPWRLRCTGRGASRRVVQCGMMPCAAVTRRRAGAFRPIIRGAGMTDRERPLANHQGQRHLERLVMLSDGIFAIAITLSAIEIKPETTGSGSLWQAWSLPLLIYFLSFFLIGLIWLVHRRIVAWLSHIAPIGTIINMALLSLVALVPVVVRFALTYPQREGAFLVYA